MTSDVIIDLSHHDVVTPDFALVYGSGVRAVILKATELDRTNGTPFTDPTFVERSQAAKGAGILVGAYAFFTDASVDQQVALFLKVALPQTNFLVLDFEPYPSSQPTLLGIKAAIAIILAKTGRKPVIYCGRYMVPEADPVLGSCALWLAEWGTDPVPGPSWSTWNLWQYTSVAGSVAVPGVGQCQRSRFNGTADQLTSWWDNPGPVPVQSSVARRHHHRRVVRKRRPVVTPVVAMAMAFILMTGGFSAVIIKATPQPQWEIVSTMAVDENAEDLLARPKLPPVAVPAHPLIPYGVSICVEGDLRRGLKGSPCAPLGGKLFDDFIYSR
jgi:lysozyme